MPVLDPYAGRVASWVSLYTVDPGEDTGWAWCFFETRSVALFPSHEIVQVAQALSNPLCHSGEMDTTDENAGTARLMDMSHRAKMRGLSLSAARSVRKVLVVESFTLRERTMDASLLSPVRLSAKLSYANHIDDDPAEWFEQSPSDAKRTITDDRLRAWGLWTPGRDHMNDAMRHLLLWIRKEKNGEH